MRQRTPWHLWTVGLYFVLLTASGAYDRVMSPTENAEYFRSQDYAEAQIAYFTDYPVFPAIFWTLGVWGGLAAALLLLGVAGRDRRAGRPAGAGRARVRFPRPPARGWRPSTSPSRC